MLIKTIIHEDFTNYKLPCMFIGTTQCSLKCCKEQYLPLSTCQNQPLMSIPNKLIDNQIIIDSFKNNNISKVICIAGLEPFDTFYGDNGVLAFVRACREQLDCDIILYTGYYPTEIHNEIQALKQYPNIILKVGRYIPNQTPHYDPILGVMLASDNQYAIKIS